MITLTTSSSSLLLPWAAAVQDQITTPPASKPRQIIIRSIIFVFRTMLQ